MAWSISLHVMRLKSLSARSLGVRGRLLRLPLGMWLAVVVLDCDGGGGGVGGGVSGGCDGG